MKNGIKRTTLCNVQRKSFTVVGEIELNQCDTAK